MSAKKLPNTWSLTGSLVLSAVVYACLGASAVALKAKGGHKWVGSANTLTTVLAVIGALFTPLSRYLLAQCQSANLQHLAHQSLTGSVKIANLHKYDVASKGSFVDLVKWRSGWRGPVYRWAFPVIAIVTSAMLKKVFTIEVQPVQTTITGVDASFVDPVNITSRVRGTAYAGAIMYNTTTSIRSGQNPNQTSWTYVVATTSDSTGMKNVRYFMPRLPYMVADGTAGYTEYAATSVPALVSETQCSSAESNVAVPEGGIENGPYNITLGYTENGLAIVQVTATRITWSCVASMSNATGSASWISDAGGNWNTSNVDMKSISSQDFITTIARWRMMADIISDSLGATAGYSGWDWETGDEHVTGYSDMLVSTRLSFAAATLAYSETRTTDTQNQKSGTACQRVQFIVLQPNWALVATAALMLLQAVLALLHLWKIGSLKLDFSILQLIAMASPGVGVGTALFGHCAGLRPELKPNGWLTVRSRQIGPDANQRHLGWWASLDPNGQLPDEQHGGPGPEWTAVQGNALYAGQASLSKPKEL
jgi:hypothetical protein